MPKIITESEIENNALETLKGLGYTILNGIDIAPDGINPERSNYSEVILKDRLKQAIDTINPNIPEEAKENALKQILRINSPNLIKNNKTFHNFLIEGISVSFRKQGRIVHDKVDLLDSKNNEFLAVNQFTVIENNNNRRPDIILFINGLPIAVIELKNPADENADLDSALNQLQTYKDQIPSLFNFNEILVISDGMTAKAGTITSNKERFMAWKTIDGSEIKSKIKSEFLDTLLKGMFNKDIFLDLIKHFIVFEKHKDSYLKKLAGYHQYHAANKAIEKTIEATSLHGNRRCGVVWHTQGSGKSLTMAFYAGNLIAVSDNPTIVVLTDRNDLDDQLFDTFSNCRDLLRQKPVQANSREKLKELLSVASGGVIFTTIQKFFPEDKSKKYPTLSNRTNIIVIADEAHRTQYGFGAKIKAEDDKLKEKYGYAKYLRDALPNASFIGFTGTPIEKTDKSTPAVFGNYIDIYDIEQAVDDGATVRIFYESRLAKLNLDEKAKPKIDPEFEELTEGEEISKKEKLKSKWARLEAIVGSEKRLKLIAKDIVNHFENRQKVLTGKGMIVCMSRRICVALYNEIIKLKPEWNKKDDDKGEIKVIMTGSASDKKEWQEHIRTKKRRKDIGERMKNPDDSLKLVIVRDMWLTGFDAPSLHTMYLDKPMQGHNLMQAIARVNRVFKDKPGGLVVDYLGIANELKKALANYTESDKKVTGIPQKDAVAIMQEKYEIITNMFHGFNYKQFFTTKPNERMTILADAMEFILKQKEGKDRFVKYVTELSQSFALSIPNEEAIAIRDEVGLFQAIKAQFIKTTLIKGKTTKELDSAIKQIVSKAITSDEIIDIFKTVGLKKPDISIISDEFLEDVRKMPQKNVAFEALKKLLNDEIKVRSKKNIVQARSFAELLANAIKRYQNKNIETAKVIEELIKLAKEIKKADQRGKKLNLNEDEIAFYDALADNDSAVKLLGDKKLQKIARELVKLVQKETTIDWTLKESVQAKLRVTLKKLLRKYEYPPDKQQKATKLILEQAKLIGEDWVEKQ